jgi:phage terminase large subunit-like protein
LRGPQHSHAWCDEIGKWENANDRATDAWDNLQLTMRVGEQPRVLATTTPRNSVLMQRLMAEAGRGKVAVATGKTTEAGDVLPADYLANMVERFEATRLGRQELDGMMMGEAEGALWSRALLERCRGAAPVAERVRTVIGVDPPAGAKGDACGIIVAALLADGNAVVLADASVERASPERWARAVANAARAWNADRVVAEKNQGGDMVASVLKAADELLPVKLVHASKGKAARAEPIAAMYEAGKVRHAGMFAELEDQMCGLMTGGRYEGPVSSTDVCDSVVFSLTELMEAARVEPSVRVL